MKKNNNKKEIIITIACSFCVGVTAIVSALIARQTLTKYELRLVPSFDNIETTDYFPLREGNFWEYIGTARNAVGDGVIVEKKVKISMSVVEVFRSANATLVTMKGHLSDAIWTLEAKHATEEIIHIPESIYGYLIVANKIFRIEEGRLALAKDMIRKGGYDEYNLIGDTNLEFEFPLFRGQVFGDFDQLVREDRSYVWHVAESTFYHVSEKDTIKEVPHYEIVHNTLPDYVGFSFVPYRGIISYSYSHHGTTAQLDLYLQNYNVHTER